MTLELILRGFLRNHLYLGNQLNVTRLRSLLRDSHLTIFEVGAADCLDTQRILTALKGADVHYHAFEPDPRFTDRNTALASDLGFTFNTLALSDFSGTATFYQSNTPYSSSLKTPNLSEINKEWPDIAFDKTVQVDVTTLDNYCNLHEVEGIDFIWADVQGNEAAFLRGSSQMLRRTKYLYTEFSNKPYYQGAPGLDEVQALLGASWKLLRNFGSDALFVNLSFRENAF